MECKNMDANPRNSRDSCDLRRSHGLHRSRGSYGSYGLPQDLSFRHRKRESPGISSVETLG